jgi:hypothetical protein
MLTGFWNSDVVEWFRDMSSSNDSFVLFFFFGFMVDLEVHEHYFIW